MSSSESVPSGRLSTRGLILLLLLAAVVLYFAIDLLLLFFAGILFAIFLHTLAEWVCRYTRLSTRLGLLVVVLLLVGLMAGLYRFTAPQLAEQVDQLTQTLPEAVGQLTDRMDEYSWGRWLREQIESAVGGGGDAGGGVAASGVVNTAGWVFSVLTNLVVSVVVVLFVGLYLAYDPEPYRRGLLRLVPKRHRLRGAEVLGVIGYTLRWWLFGQILAMLVVGVFVWIGLTLLGVPLALALGVLAGVLEFVPTFGPPLAFVPALLLALQQGADSAVWILVLYVIVQGGEAYLLTPLIQQRAVDLPPVVTVAAQVLLGTTIGPIGLLVAVPLVAVVLVLVKMLYVDDKLGDDVDVAGEDEAASKVRRDDKAVP